MAKAKTKAKKKAEPAVKGSPAFLAAVKTVAAEFKAAMQAAGMDETALANKLKISESRVWQLLDGRAVSLRTMADVFAACGKKFKISAA